MSDTATTQTDRRLHGVIAALLTPMRDGGAALDLEATARLVAWLVDRGVHGLFLAGTTGEGLYLSPEEHHHLTRAVVKAAHGVPSVVHVGALTTAQAVLLARQAVRAEATAVAAAPPFYYAATPGEVLAYYRAVSLAAAPLPVYLYNIPSHARTDLSPELVREIRDAVPRVVGIKDSSGFPGRISDLVKTLGPDFDILCGNDESALNAFQAGAAGVVSSGAGIFPELYLNLYQAWSAGKSEDPKAAQQIITAMQQALGNGARLGWYKYVVAERGIPIGGVRSPLLDPSPAEREAIRAGLQRLGLL